MMGFRIACLDDFRPVSLSISPLVHSTKRSGSMPGFEPTPQRLSEISRQKRYPLSYTACLKSGKNSSERIHVNKIFICGKHVQMIRCAGGRIDNHGVLGSIPECNSVFFVLAYH